MKNCHEKLFGSINHFIPRETKSRKILPSMGLNRPWTRTKLMRQRSCKNNILQHTALISNTINVLPATTVKSCLTSSLCHVFRRQCSPSKKRLSSCSPINCFFTCFLSTYICPSENTSMILSRHRSALGGVGTQGPTRRRHQHRPEQKSADDAINARICPQRTETAVLVKKKKQVKHR